MTGFSHPLTVDEVDARLDFLGVARARGLLEGGRDLARWEQVARGQLRGTTALYNRLTHQRATWLSDEVGMGKTYVALGVAHLLRMAHPGARVLYLLPTSRLFTKWQGDFDDFARHCVRQVDHRVLTFNRQPLHQPRIARSLRALARTSLSGLDASVMASTGAFSLAIQPKKDRTTGEPEPIQKTLARRWTEVRALFGEGGTLEPPPERWLDAATELGLKVENPSRDSEQKRLFKVVYAAQLNRLLSTFDLVICDESHNLKAGRRSGAARNLTLAAALAGFVHPEGERHLIQRVDRLLCLSATPIERSYRELPRQAEVFGLDEPRVSGAGPGFAALRSDESPEQLAEARTCAKSFILRRITGLLPARDAARLGPDHPGFTKNQYRREWRSGGLHAPDAPLALPSAESRLTVALLQKHVLQALFHRAREEQPNVPRPSVGFTMGMLTSFESFRQSMGRRLGSAGEAEAPQTHEEADGVGGARGHRSEDADVVGRLAASHAKALGGAGLAHPKQDEVSARLAGWAERGEKSLVFVRRIRTTYELGEKVQRRLDDALKDRLASRLRLAGQGPADVERWAGLPWRRYQERLQRRPWGGAKAEESGERHVPSFFAWMFWGDHKVESDTGEHPRPGGWWITNRAAVATHRWSLALEDSPLQDMLRAAESEGPKSDEDLVRDWLNRSPGRRQRIRKEAASWLPTLETSSIGPRHIFHAWQAAALRELAQDEELTPTLRAAAGAWARWLVPKRRSSPHDPARMGSLEAALCARPLFAALSSTLAAALHVDVAGALRRGDRHWWRPVRNRELIRAQLRLGGPAEVLFVALVSTPTDADFTAVVDHLVDACKQELEGGQPRPGSWLAELAAFGAHGSSITDESDLALRGGSVSLEQFRRTNGDALAQQTPVYAVHGGMPTARLLRQFKTPGYPQVLVSTDVLQEGVDLHPFCRRVVHYGITWSATGTEQRNGRVDRIGSLTHRTLELAQGAAGADATDAAHLAANSKLQVYFPHLPETLEVFQMRTLYDRMNTLLERMHEDFDTQEALQPFVGLDGAVQQSLEYPAAPTSRLCSAFEETEADLKPEAAAALPPSTALASATAARDQVEASLRSLASRFEVALFTRPDPERADQARWLLQLRDHRASGQAVLPGERVQPVTVAVRAARELTDGPLQGRGLHWVAIVRSPVGQRSLRAATGGPLPTVAAASRFVAQQPGLALEAVELLKRSKSHDGWFQIEAEVSLDPDLPAEVLARRIAEAAAVADRLERDWRPVGGGGPEDLPATAWERGNEAVGATQGRTVAPAPSPPAAGPWAQRVEALLAAASPLLEERGAAVAAGVPLVVTVPRRTGVSHVRVAPLADDPELRVSCAVGTWPRCTGQTAEEDAWRWLCRANVGLTGAALVVVGEVLEAAVFVPAEANAEAVLEACAAVVRTAERWG